MRIVFLGTGDFGVPALRALHAAGHAIVAAVSQPDRPAGRGRNVRPTPIHATAAELGLRHYQTEDVNAPHAAAALGEAELGVVAAFGQKLGPRLLAALPHGFVNIHGSLLPKYRGAAPVQWAMINGEDVSGVTVFQLNERWDAGAIWARRETPIRDTETAEELHDRLAQLGAELIVEVLARIATGRVRPVQQDAGEATRAPKLSKADGTIDWTRPARLVVRRIHGLWPWPAAACTFVSRGGRRERLLLARAAVADANLSDADAAPGTFGADGTIGAGQGRVRLLEVRPAGKKLMPFEAFAHGRRVGPGDRLLPAEL